MTLAFVFTDYSTHRYKATGLYKVVNAVSVDFTFRSFNLNEKDALKNVIYFNPEAGSSAKKDQVTCWILFKQLPKYNSTIESM